MSRYGENQILLWEVLHVVGKCNWKNWEVEKFALENSERSLKKMNEANCRITTRSKF